MKFNLLIVDDSAITRAIIKRTIKMAELTVENIYEAGNGQSGLEVLGQASVDLVLADLNMPEMDGFEMTRRMLADERLKHIPVVVISAEPNAADFARDVGIHGCLSKPFTPEAVRSAVLQALGVEHV
ncbi:MAG: response regulator [Phycisphaerales bacterium]|nr:response regulator [Phycisphaerales bacterium]